MATATGSIAGNGIAKSGIGAASVRAERLSRCRYRSSPYRQRPGPRQAAATPNNVAASLWRRWRRPGTERRCMISGRPAIIISRDDGARRHGDRLVIGQRMGCRDPYGGPERRADLSADKGAEPRIDSDRRAQAGPEGGAYRSAFNSALGRLLCVNAGELVGVVPLRVGAIEEGEFVRSDAAGQPDAERDRRRQTGHPKPHSTIPRHARAIIPMRAWRGIVECGFG